MQKKLIGMLVQGFILHFLSHRTQGPARLVIHRFSNLNFMNIPKNQQVQRTFSSGMDKVPKQKAPLPGNDDKENWRNHLI